MPIIPGFKILRSLNQGGFGHVHLARRVSDGAHAAIKVLHLPNDDNVRRFYREAKLLHHQLGNPHVVTLFEANFKHAPQYIAMEYCAGGSLRGWVGKGIDWMEIVFALSHAAAGLATIHEFGGFHRDIKPDNLLVALGPNGTKVIKVGDFGLARVPNTTAWPMTTSPAGTRGYMAPELWHGASYESSCDVYSLGVTGIELLTGGLVPQDLQKRGDLPAQLRELLLSMVRHEPCLRPDILACHQSLVSLREEEFTKRQAGAAAAREVQVREAQQRARDEQARQERQRAQARKPPDSGPGVGLGLGLAAFLVGGIALATMNSRDNNGRWRGRNGQFRGGPWG